MGIKIDDVIAAAEKQFGERVVMRINDKKKLKVPSQPTGIPGLDLALGVRGLPKGRIVEIFGPESSGKTSLALSLIAQVQRTGGWGWYGDMEHAIDPEWAEQLGVNMDKLLISQPDNGEQCLDLAAFMIKKGVIDIVVIDSVSALVPQKELDGEAGDAVVGLQARLMSQAMRKLVPVTSRTECITVFINQIREKIGITWGSNETTSGGRALKFSASVRIDMRKIANEKDGEDIIGSIHKIKIVKNKVAPPFKICEVTLTHDNGFDLATNLLELAVEKNIMTKSGNTYSFEDKVLGVGRNKAIVELNENYKDRLQEIYYKVIGKKIKTEEEKPVPAQS